jgi:hypothetical protein
MLTVKHITIGGDESLHLAREVTFTPSEAAKQVKTRSPIECVHEGGNVTIIREDFVPLGFSGGTVFVMNDKGKTVDRYDLGASMVARTGDLDEDVRIHRDGRQDKMQAAA